MIIMLGSGQVAARDVLLLAGYSGSTLGNYGYLGTIMPISSPYLYKDGWLLRLWFAQANFTYLSVLGQDIRGKASEIEASVGYRTYLGDKNNRLSIYIGGVHRNARLSPDDPYSHMEERRNGARIQGDLFLRPTTNLDFSVMGSHTTHIGDKWLRIRPGYVFEERVIFGPEVVFIRGDAYNRRRVGIVLESVPLGRNAELTFSAGRERDRVQSTSGYATLSLVSWF
ncbi:MAG: hypothetical protein C3F19_16940 [Rhodocyclales bacterium]|nr:MAG: hypothetical protein C3F19_16940 [Rhodocyclales bacterium]